MTETVNDKVLAWATERGLNKSDPHVQATKVMEELGELMAAMNKHQHDELLDAFGDVQVTLIILAAQLGVKYAQTLEDAYKVIADRQEKPLMGFSLNKRN